MSLSAGNGRKSCVLGSGARPVCTRTGRNASSRGSRTPLIASSSSFRAACATCAHCVTPTILRALQRRTRAMTARPANLLVHLAFCRAHDPERNVENARHDVGPRSSQEIATAPTAGPWVEPRGVQVDGRKQHLGGLRGCVRTPTCDTQHASPIHHAYRATACRTSVKSGGTRPAQGPWTQRLTTPLYTPRRLRRRTPLHVRHKVSHNRFRAIPVMAAIKRV